MQATEQEIKLHEISVSYALIYRGRDIVFVKVREMGKTRSVIIHIFNSISVDGRLLFPGRYAKARIRASHNTVVR